MRFRDSAELPELVDRLREAGYDIPAYLSDEQLRVLEYNPEYVAKRNEPCLICNDTGSYRYLGKTFDCPDDAYGHVAMRLARWYWLHNIPLQYQQLVFSEWPVDTPDQQHALRDMNEYLNNFRGYSTNGIGLTFYSQYLGTGKTWAATAVLKELVKRGCDGWFVPFSEVKGYYEITDYDKRDYLISRVQGARILVLDEVVRPFSEAQRNFYADKLEELIRPRTNSNFPTIITTNMTMDELDVIYPRVFSLLMAKNITVSLNSPEDARQGSAVWKRQVETIQNGESLPID